MDVGVGTEVGGKGEGGKVVGRDVEVGKGMEMVDVIVGIAVGVETEEQEARMQIERKKSLFIRRRYGVRQLAGGL